MRKCEGNAPQAEAPKATSGVEYGERCLLSSRLEGLGERRELPERGPGQRPAGNAFWRILKATERSLLHLYADALSSSNNVSCYITYAVSL